MGEQQLGLGQKYPSFFYILISWGLGGGLVLDGAYFRGADGRSGEIGFLPSGDGRSQVQAHVSLSGLAVLLQEQGATLADLQQRDARIDAIVDRWLDNAVECLREPLAAVNCLINPAAILIGGRLPGDLIDRLIGESGSGAGRNEERLACRCSRRAGNACGGCSGRRCGDPAIHFLPAADEHVAVEDGTHFSGSRLSAASFSKFVFVIWWRRDGRSNVRWLQAAAKRGYSCSADATYCYLRP